MTNGEIIEASAKKANNDVKETKAARVLKEGPKMFLAATTIAIGLSAKGQLSNKVAATASALGALAVISSLSKPVNAAVGGVMNMNSKEEDVKQTEKHPVVNAALGVGALFGASCLALKGINKGMTKLASKFEPTANAVKNSIIEKASKLDNSSLGKFSEKVSSKVSEIAQKHPKMANLAKDAAFVAPIATYAGVSATALNKVENDRDKLFVQNVNNLVLCREYAQAALDKTDKTSNK